MTESSFETNIKMSLEKYSGQSKRYNQMQSQLYSPSDTQSKPIQHITPVLQQKKIFGFQIYVDNDILNKIPNIDMWFEKIVQETNSESIRFNSDLSIPDLDGHNIHIYDKDMGKKYQSCKIILNDVYQIFKKVKTQQFSIIIFVPQGMVSLLIGTKGHQINKIMKQSHTTIVVNQPINRMTYRTVKIQGYYSDIALACRIIYEILEEKSSIAYSIQKQPSQLDYSKTKVKTKLLLSNSLTGYLSSKKKAFIKKVQEQTKCAIKFKQDLNSQFLKKEEQICVLTGKLEDVQAMLVVIVNLVHDYYSQDYKNIDYTLKMLIPSNYVTKLIGQKGYMIRDIIDKSGGAQIKILSEKQAERDASQCVITINGSRQNKIDAICLILEQIQCFKNGGPILQSGRSINQNLAQQFKNSIPLRQNDIIQNANPINSSTLSDPFRDKMAQENNLNVIINGQATALPFDPQIACSPPNLCLNQIDNIKLENKKEMEDLIEQKNKIKQKIQTIKQKKIIEFQRNKKKPSYSRSRDKKQKRKRQNKLSKREKSKSSSIQFKHQKDYVEIKFVVPKKLANDHNELTYIQSLCHSEIKNSDQKVEGSNQAIICIRGLIKDNQHCIKLLQKRLSRISTKQSSG